MPHFFVDIPHGNSDSPYSPYSISIPITLLNMEQQQQQVLRAAAEGLAAKDKYKVYRH